MNRETRTAEPVDAGSQNCAHSRARWPLLVIVAVAAIAAPILTVVAP